jgi:hypothetical protein
MPGLIDDESIVMNLYERRKQFVKLTPARRAFLGQIKAYGEQKITCHAYF